MVIPAGASQKVVCIGERKPITKDKEHSQMLLEESKSAADNNLNTANSNILEETKVKADS